MGSGVSTFVANIDFGKGPKPPDIPPPQITDVQVHDAIAQWGGNFAIAFGLCSIIQQIPSPERFAAFICGQLPPWIAWLKTQGAPQWLIDFFDFGEAPAVNLCRNAVIAGGRALLAEVKSFCRKGTPMATTCVSQHSVTSKVQGPGACCAAFTKAGFSSTNPAPIGTRVAATDRKGRCFVCQVEASTSKRNPGAPVIKRGKSLGLCPTTLHGCCVVGTAAQQTA